MPKSIYCTFCKRPPFGTIGELNTHYRQFLPELSIYLGRRDPQTKPAHPIRILREFLRHNSARNIRDLLDAPTEDENLQRVLNAFVLHCYGREPGVEDRVPVKYWDDMVAAAVKKYMGHRNKRRMIEQVREMVERAVEAAFARDGEDGEDEEDTDDDGHGGALQPIELSDEAEDDDEEEEEEEEEDELNAVDDQPAPADARPNVQPALSIKSANVSRGLMIGNDINFGIQIHGEPKKPGGGKRQRQGSKKGDAKKTTSRFASFPILLLSVDVLDTIIVVPAEGDTTFEDVKRLVDQHADNPLKGAGVQVALHGTGEWDCLWSEEVWRAVKAQANTTAEPTLYQVRFRIATAEVVA